MKDKIHKMAMISLAVFPVINSLYLEETADVIVAAHRMITLMGEFTAVFFSCETETWAYNIQTFESETFVEIYGSCHSSALPCTTAGCSWF